MLDVCTDSPMPGGSLTEYRPTEAATTNHQTSTNGEVPFRRLPQALESKFDPKNYRQAQPQKVDDAGGWARKQQTVIPVRKPSKKQFVHAHPSADYRADGMPTIEDEATGEIYLLSAGLDLPVDIENKVDFLNIATAITADGSVFLWALQEQHEFLESVGPHCHQGGYEAVGPGHL